MTVSGYAGLTRCGHWSRGLLPRFPLFDLLGLSLSLSSLRCPPVRHVVPPIVCLAGFRSPEREVARFPRLMLHTSDQTLVRDPKRSPLQAVLILNVDNSVRGRSQIPRSTSERQRSVADSDRMAASMREGRSRSLLTTRSPYAGEASRRTDAMNASAPNKSTCGG